MGTARLGKERLRRDVHPRLAASLLPSTIEWYFLLLIHSELIPLPMNMVPFLTSDN